MNKKIAIGVGVTSLLLIVCVGAVFATDWNDYTEYDTPQKIPFTNVVDDSNNLDENSLNFNLFEKYGAVLLVMALLMFGSMIGGVCIAREEGDSDDTD